MLNIKTLMQDTRYPWIVWGLAAGFFFFEYFVRVAPGVMVDQLMHDLHVMAFGLGSLSAFFYYAYIAMQIPVGMMADRFKARWLLFTMILLIAASCLLFASAHTIHRAAFARFVMGFSGSFAFVTALRIAVLWFPSNRFGLLAGLTQAVGMLGAAIGQAPMAFSVKEIGWRPTMCVIAGLFIVLAILVNLLVRDPSDKGQSIERERLQSAKEVLNGLWLILKNPQTWWNGLFVGLLYAPTEAIGELWGVKFISQAHQLSIATAAFATGVIFIGWTFGGPLGGWISDRINRRKPVLFSSAALCLLFMTLIIYVPGLPLWLLCFLLFCYGLSNTGVATSYAVASEINPRTVSGTSMAFANMSSVFIGAGLQPLIGWTLDHNWHGTLQNGLPFYSLQDFHLAMLPLPICLILAIVAVKFIRETNCQNIADTKN